MNYNNFLTLINQNTNNPFDDYKSLCRFCLQKKSNGVDIGNDASYNRRKQRDALLNNHHIVTKKYLPISPDYPNFVCSTCESNLSRYAVFVQQIEENAENWEMFLKRDIDVKVPMKLTENPVSINVDAIKMEYCDDIFYDVPETKFNIPSPVNDEKSVEIVQIPTPWNQRIRMNEKTTSASSRKRIDKSNSKLIYINLSTEYERTCKLCNEPTFSSLRRFYKHQCQQHPGEKAFACDICGTKFNQKAGLISHMDDRHSGCGKKHQCQFCAKLFFSDREMKGHEKIHLNTRNYICNLCGKGFKQKTTLNIHLKSKAHNADYKTVKKKKAYNYNKLGQKVYRCELCTPSTLFLSSDERAVHKNLVHRNFECDICKNSFMVQESLDSHKLRHSDKPRPFVCTVCEATFNQSSHLASHYKRKHTDNKSFQCSFCDKRFFEGCDLTAHVNLVHKKHERVKCGECSCDFATEKYLQRHMLQKHSTDVGIYDCKICGKRNISGAKLDLHHRLKHL